MKFLQKLVFGLSIMVTVVFGLSPDIFALDIQRISVQGSTLIPESTIPLANTEYPGFTIRS